MKADGLAAGKGVVVAESLDVSVFCNQFLAAGGLSEIHAVFC